MSAQGLPAHILALFTPRPPPQHLPPTVEKKPVVPDGCANFNDFFEIDKPPKREKYETPLEKRMREHKEKNEKHKSEVKVLAGDYDPHKDPNAVGDPFKTLFVARISYDTTEKKLKREFEVFGSIKRVRMVYDQKGKPRGYAFIEYEHERDLKNAYKQGDGKKIDGRRVMVDVERGRTVEGWVPRRLGGGRGPGRVGKPSKKKAKMLALQEKAKKDAKESGKDEKEKEKEKRSDRDRNNHRNRERQDKEKDKEKEKEKEKEKDRDEKKDKEKTKDRAKEKEKTSQKDKEREKEKDRKKDGDRKRDRSRSRDRDRKAKKARE